MNNRGFTLVELLGTITIMGILFSMAIFSYSRYQDRAKRQAYDTMASSASDAAGEYYMDNPGDSDPVSFKDLKDGDYLNSITDPSSSSMECKGKVEQIGDKSNTKGALDSYKYTVYECCANYNYKYTFPGKTKEKMSDDSNC